MMLPLLAILMDLLNQNSAKEVNVSARCKLYKTFLSKKFLLIPFPSSKGPIIRTLVISPRGIPQAKEHKNAVIRDSFQVLFL